MTRRDDEEPLATTYGIPRPRDTARTLHGVGADEIRGARNGDTPSSGMPRIDVDRDNGNGPPTPRSNVPGLLARADAELILESINQAIADRKLETEALRIDLTVKVDTCIDDVRLLAKAQRAGFDGMRRELRSLRAHVKPPKEPKERADTIADMQVKIIELDMRLGKAPMKLGERVSSPHEMTAAELVEYEQGTGAMGTIARLFVRLGRLEIRVTASAVVGVSIVQIAYLLMQSGHERLVLLGALMLTASGFAAYVVRRVRNRTKRLR